MSDQTHRKLTLAIVRKDVRRHEGFEPEPYKCTANKTTIGIGFNIHEAGKCAHPDIEPYARGEKKTITEDESFVIVDKIINQLYDRLQDGKSKGLFDPFRFVEFSPRQAAALINMAYQMGIPRLKGFKKMILAMNEGRWEDAKIEALDSAWKRQTESRAHEVAAELLEA